MMKLLQIIFLLTGSLWSVAFAQTPVEQFRALNKNVYLLDQAAAISKPSFAYSLRKLRRSYTGFSLRVRRGTDNAEADVAFEAMTNTVGANSMVTLTAAGSSGLAMGSQMTLGTFKGTQKLYVKTWYDQGLNAYHATQTTTTIQPELLFNTSGIGNTKPSLVFDGSRYLKVEQPLENVLNNGAIGTFLLTAKVGSNTQRSFSFGYVTPENNHLTWRWQIHLNWSDGKAYFDAGEPCCPADRLFNNNDSKDFWKQYSFVRGTDFKVARRSGTEQLNDNSSAGYTSKTGGDFWIGRAMNTSAGDKGFIGNLTEAIMFPKDFNTLQLDPIEFNQIRFWGL